MDRQILIPTQIRKELDAKFKCKRNELSRALAYERNSSRAKMLRIAALEAGGVIYTGAHAPNGFCPDVETIYYHKIPMMRQRFGAWVELLVSRETNAAVIIVNGEPVAKLDGLTLRSWGDALYALQQIYNQLND